MNVIDQSQYDSQVLYLADKYGHVQAHVRGGGDQYGGDFFKSIRLKMGDSSVKEPYKQHVWTHACLKAIATALSSVPFVIVRDMQQGNGAQARLASKLAELRRMPSRKRVKVTQSDFKARGIEVVESGPMYDTFRDVNPLMTRSQLWEATVIQSGLHGDCFWTLEDKNGDPIASPTDWPAMIWPYGHGGWQPNIDGEGRLTGWKRKWAAGGKEHEKSYKLFQVIHMYQYNPYNPLNGLGTYEVAKNAASQDYKSSKYNEALLDNGGDPGGVIKVPGMPRGDERKAITTTFEDRHKGPGNSGKVALLMGGADYVFSPRTQRDMEFMEGRKWNRDETFGAFRTPKQLASIYEGINYATAKIQLRQFWENVVIPSMVYYEDMLNSKLFSRATIANGYYCMFDLSTVEALREDMDTNSQIAERLNKIGIPTTDIIDLLELSVEKRSWQNQWWVSMSMVPVGDAGKAEEPVEEPQQDTTSLKLKKSITSLQRIIDKEKHWTLYVARVLDPIEKPFQKKLKSYFYALRQEQMEAWYNATKSVSAKAIPSPGELNDILFNNQEWQEKLVKIAKPFEFDTAEAAIEQVADELGTPPWQTSDPRVVAILSEKANKIKGVTDRFWKSLQATLTEGIEASETVQELSARLRDSFNLAASPSRTLTIARTETAQCASEVRHANYKYLGIQKHEWNTAGDENVRPDHVKLGELEPKPIDHNYMQDLGKPGTLTKPSDIGGPADQVINCRCVELAII